jgi:hypothetical protein
MPEQLSKTFFSESMNTLFRLQADLGEMIDLELIELKEGYSSSRQEQFSITFRGPGNFILPQKTYRVEHDRIGQFDLFIVPIGQDKTSTYYEAVFNRLIASQEVKA